MTLLTKHTFGHTEPGSCSLAIDPDYPGTYLSLCLSQMMETIGASKLFLRHETRNQTVL